MHIKRFFALLAGAALIHGAAACSDDDGQQNNNQPDATVWDASVIPDGAPPDANTCDPGQVGCTGAPVTSPQPMGACCNVDEDCLDGTCWFGYCSLRGCEDNSDCDPTPWGNWECGTPMSCNSHSIDGIITLCAPGSLQECGAAGDSACPTGEICVLAFNPTATEMDNQAMRGLCVTALTHTGVIASGGQCDDLADPGMYQCEAPAYLVNGCIGRRCTHGCDPENPTNTCPTDMECAGPLAFGLEAGGVLSGGGICVGTWCGSIQFSGDDENDVRIPGIDSECPAGEICVPNFFMGDQGDLYEFRCIPSVSGLGDPGDDCEHAEKFDMFCNHSTLCLQESGTYDWSAPICESHDDCAANEVCVDHSFGASRCGAKPPPGFCSKGCRTDGDCTGMGETAYCIEVGVEFPNEEEGFLTGCYPDSELFDATRLACTSEDDCDADKGEGCLHLSQHSEYQFCGVAVNQTTDGSDCETGGVNDCDAGEACVEDDDAGTFRCTVVSDVGDACIPDPDENTCRSGLCLDHELEDDNGTANFCSAPCETTVDCGANQVCENILYAENDPTTEADDVEGGLCRPMVLHPADQCPGVACTGGKACDNVTGRCYLAAADWGDACAVDSDCPQNGLCDTDSDPNGVCYLPGCAVDGDCPGGNGKCSDALGPVKVCLEACTTTCSRTGYTCTAGACVP